jgi:2-dehydro-3-deoxygluconokinase
MSHGLAIPPQGAIDFLSLGALVHRIDPGIVPFRKATEAKIHVSGGEFNVAANLADCFGMKAAIASAMVNYPIGDLIAERVRAIGVRPIYRTFEHDGVRGPNMATVFSDRGFGVRGPIVFYNRANEAAAELKPGDFDWPAIFAEGVRWFHSGGIFASLSHSCADLLIEAMQAARKAGAIVSFDLNYREKLWKNSGGTAKAREVFADIVQYADVLIGVDDMLFPAKAQSNKTEHGPEAVTSLIHKTAEHFPNIKAIAATWRDVHSTNRHTWRALAWFKNQSNGKYIETPDMELDVYDRVGSGDGFAAGFIYGLLNGESAEQALHLGWAHGALLTTYPGDTTMATLEQVKALANGASAVIQR